VSVVYWYSLSNHRPVPRNTRRPDPTDPLGAGLRRVEVTPALFKPRDQRRLFKVCSLVHFGSARPRVRQMSRCACTHGTHITHITHMRSLSPRLPSLFLIDTHTPCLSPPTAVTNPAAHHHGRRCQGQTKTAAGGQRSCGAEQQAGRAWGACRRPGAGGAARPQRRAGPLAAKPCCRAAMAACGRPGARAQVEAVVAGGRAAVRGHNRGVRCCGAGAECARCLSALRTRDSAVT